MLERLVVVVVNEEGMGWSFDDAADSIIVVEFNMTKVTLIPSFAALPLQHPGYPSPDPRSNHFSSTNSNSPLINVLDSRRTSPSPVRLGRNLTRFDIRAWSPTTLLHSSSSSLHPKLA
jgi:hypothetical protein